MKKTIQHETHLCDSCNADAGNYPYICLKCSKELCWECAKTQFIKYTHAVSFSGGGDGYYCHACDLKLAADWTDKLFLAYRKIASLRSESESFYTDFRLREKAAESELKKLQK